MSQRRKTTIGFPWCTEELTFSAGAGVWDPLYSVSNLGDWSDLSFVGRTQTNLASSLEFIATSTTGKPLRCGWVGFVNSNFDTFAQVRLQFYSSATSLIDANRVEDTGWVDANPRVYAYGSLPFQDRHWLHGRRVARDFAGLTPLTIVELSRNLFFSGVRVNVRHQHRSEYWQAGFVEFAVRQELPVSFSYGSAYGFRARSTVKEAAGGAKRTRLKAKPRFWNATFNNMDRMTSLDTLFDLQREADIVRPILFDPSPDDVDAKHKEAIFARLTDTPRFTRSAVRRNTTALEAEEAI